MNLQPDRTLLPPDADPSGDSEDLSAPGPKGHRDTQPRNPDDLRRELYEALHGQADSPGSSASAVDTLREAITHLSAVIEQLDGLYQAAESIEDKIKLSSALGVATVRLSTLLRTQKFLSPNSRSEVDEALRQAIYNVNKEWGRV